MAQCNSNANSLPAFGIASYNLFGLNSGHSLLQEMCDNPNISIIAVQETWLTPNNLSRLNCIHPDFIGYGISAMNKKLGETIYTGRPFGGVGFLWRKSIASQIHVIGGDDDGRCLAISLNRQGHTPIKILSVYFPCYSSGVLYSTELGNCLGFIEELLDPQDNVIIIGDVNFTCSGFVQGSSVFHRLSIFHCDNLFSDVNPT
jgi:exonuclease III